MAEELRIEVLGGLRMTLGEVPVRGFVSSKAPALLAYLVVTARPHFRAALAALLWSELGDTAARMNLRHVLVITRQHLAPYLVITRDTVAFDRTSAYWLDLEQFEAALSVSPRFRRIAEHAGATLRGLRARAMIHYLGIPRWKLPRLARHGL